MGKVTDYSPVVRLRKSFSLKCGQEVTAVRGGKSEKVKGKKGGGEGSYDFEFIIYLREVLAINTGAAQWLDKEQGLFSIHNKEDFVRGWRIFKGLDWCSWDSLCQQTLSIFRQRNILKQQETQNNNVTVFQVLSIKKLLL